MQTVEQIEDKLRMLVDDMGTWSDPFVEFYTRGVTGKVKCAESCIVANYVSAQLDGAEVLVDGDTVNVGVGAYDTTSDVYLPVKVTKFIREFDAGKYPELVAADD